MITLTRRPVVTVNGQTRYITDDEATAAGWTRLPNGNWTNPTAA